MMLKYTILMACAVLSTALTPARMFAQRGDLHGVVRDSTGQPLERVTVGIVSHRKLERTDERGRFRLRDVPAGTVEVSVRRLGFVPQTLTVSVRANASDTISITLVAQPAVLDAIAVSAMERRRRTGIEQFHERRIRGVGLYITRAEIDERPHSTMSALLTGVSGIRLIRLPGGGYGARFPPTSIRPRDCAPMLWIDGQKAPGMEIDDISPVDIEGIEIYSGPSTVPMRFSPHTADESCGAIIVWTRPPPVG